MDKTLRPDFGGRTNGSAGIPTTKQILLKEPVSTDNSQTRVLTDLPPAIYMVTGSSCREFPLDADEFEYTIGRSQDATVTIDDNALSPVHLSIMKVKTECLFMDKGKRDITAFDGIATRQAFTPIESRLVTKLGQHWLIYEASNVLTLDTVSINKKMIAAELSKSELPGKVTLKYKNKEWQTAKDSCLIGTHPICDVKVYSDSAAAFTALVYWTQDGVFIDKMGTCRAAICVNGVRISKPVKLEGGEVISIGKEEIDVEFEGDVNARSFHLFKKVKAKPEMALTVLSGADSKTYPLMPNSMYKIGRVSTADIQIDSPSVSRSHSNLMVRDKMFSIQDNGSFNKTIVNREEVEKATVFPGDLIELGDVALLAHYNVTRF
ncbi:MAG: FHA domain-containing protein [Lentisphaerales bacterium]|nr:FHA domain-containing protein [Lentisphaerales bacterium]